jgi:diaminohydroxyphosphoribosylaminopyrimidine deaminase/5-amino-6-(5-phosphoribosylamino)uracil reductase
VLTDDPLLTSRPGQGRQPLRIVLDAELEIRSQCRLLATAREWPVLIAAGRQTVRTKKADVDRVRKRGADVLPVTSRNKMIDLKALLSKLAALGVQHVLVEGGPTVLGGFLEKRLADEVVVYIAPLVLGAKVPDRGISRSRVTRLEEVEHKVFDDDIRVRGLVRKKR